jgi:hypothetical protein
MASCKCKARRCSACGQCHKCSCLCIGSQSKKSAKYQESSKKAFLSLAKSKVNPKQVPLTKTVVKKVVAPVKSAVASTRKSIRKEENTELKPISSERNMRRRRGSEFNDAAAAAPPKQKKVKVESLAQSDDVAARQRTSYRNRHNRSEKLGVIEKPAPIVQDVDPNVLSRNQLDEELKGMMQREIEDRTELMNLQRQIFELEGAYLRRNQHAGNITKGWVSAEKYLKEWSKDQMIEQELLGENPPELKGQALDTVNQQRLFSFSSLSSPAELLAQKWVEGKSDAEIAAMFPSPIDETPALRSSLRHRSEIHGQETETAVIVLSQDQPRKPKAKSKRRR